MAVLQVGAELLRLTTIFRAGDVLRLAAQHLFEKAPGKPVEGCVLKNETPKKALGDRRQEWRFHCQVPHTETKPHLRNAAVPRRFKRHSFIEAKRQ